MPGVLLGEGLVGTVTVLGVLGSFIQFGISDIAYHRFGFFAMSIGIGKISNITTRPLFADI